LLTTASIGVSVTFRYAEYYAAALIYYLVIVSIVMAIQAVVERRFRWISKQGPPAPTFVSDEVVAPLATLPTTSATMPEVAGA
jgi:hypothetical protein